MTTHRIQVVQDVGKGKVSSLSSSSDVGRASATGSNNITLTFGYFEEEENSEKKIANEKGDNNGPDAENGKNISESPDNPKPPSEDSESNDKSKNNQGEEKARGGLLDDKDIEKVSDSNAKNGKSITEEESYRGQVDQTKREPEKPRSRSSARPSKSGTANDEQARQDDMAFCDPRQNQVFHMLTEIQSLRKSDSFADLTVKVRDQEFRCHKFLLACNSAFFLNIIQNAEREDSSNDDSRADDDTVAAHSDGGDEQKVNKPRDENCAETMNSSGDQFSPDGAKPSERSGATEITLRGVRPDIFSKILDFLYCTFDDVINEDSALDLLLAADSLQLKFLSRTCANFITDTLSPNNVFDVIGLWESGCAKLFEPKVVRRCHEVIREHFTNLCQREEFVTLSRQHMIPLVADSMLHVDNEMALVQALLRWVRFRPAERTADMTLMLQHIRFPLMTSQDLDKLTQVTLLAENSLAMALVEESRAYGTMDYNDRLAWPRQNCISRCLFPTRDFILWTADRDKGLHLYSIIDGQHHKATGFSKTITDGTSSGPVSFDSTSSICCYGSKIFFTGGEFSTDMTWSVDTATGEIKVHAKMPRGRKFHSMVASRGCLYCLGGQDKRGYTVLDSVDAYVMEKDVWIKVGLLSVPAYNMAAVVSGGAIYLVGGADQSGQPLRLIQCFIALRSGLYSAFKIELSNMPPSLLCARAVTSGFDGLVYIVCGHGEVYKFEPERRQLSHLTTLKILSDNPRVRFGLAHVGGCLVVIGGHQLGRAMQEPIRSVCLDIASKTEVRDYSPLLPGDIINTCSTVKLSSNTLNLFE